MQDRTIWWYGTRQLWYYGWYGMVGMAVLVSIAFVIRRRSSLATDGQIILSPLNDVIIVTHWTNGHDSTSHAATLKFCCYISFCLPHYCGCLPFAVDYIQHTSITT